MTLDLVRWSRRFDVVIVQGFSYWSFVNAAGALLVSRLLGKRAILYYRGGAAERFLPRLRPWGRLLFRLPHRIVVPSGFLAEVFAREGVRAEIVPNVIDVNRWRFRERVSFGPRLLWVRHLRPGYNPLMALRVFRRVKERHPGATLDFVGEDGPAKPALEEAIAGGGAAGVRLLGRLSHEEIIRLAEERDIFLNTSSVDNQPNSVIEAMSLGLLVVSTNVGGVPYLVADGKTGILVDPDDDERMAAAILDAIAAPERCRSLCHAARSRIEEHDWSRVREAWAGVL